MERQNKLLTALSVILLVLVAIVMIVREKVADGPKSVDLDAIATEDLFGWKADSVNALSLISAGGEIAFEKKEGVWTMTAPSSAAIEADKVASIVDRFEDLEIETRTLAGKSEDYGLDPSKRIEVKFGLLGGATESVFIGTETNIGYKTYASRTADGGASLLSSKVRGLVEVKADDFRSKKLLDARSYSARRIRIKDASSEVILRKDDSGWWLGDTGPRADGEAVATYLTDATGAEAASFLDGKTAAELGLDNPAATISIEDDGGTHELKLGARDADGANAIGLGDAPVRVDSADIDKLLKLTGWVSTQLLPIESWKVEGVNVTLGEKTYVAKRVEGEWKGADDQAKEGVSDVIDALREAQVDRSGAPAFSGTWGSIQLGLGNDKAATVRIGDELPTGGRVAKDDAGGPAFVIPSPVLAELAQKL